jgi:carbonic anhydrase
MALVLEVGMRKMINISHIAELKFPLISQLGKINQMKSQKRGTLLSRIPQLWRLFLPSERLIIMPFWNRRESLKTYLLLPALMFTTSLVNAAACGTNEVKQDGFCYYLDGSDIEAKSCASESELKSMAGRIETFVLFKNQSNRVVKTYWLDYYGNRKLYQTLSPSQQGRQQTYITHPWVITDENDQCLGIFLPQVAKSEVVINDSEQLIATCETDKKNLQRALEETQTKLAACDKAKAECQAITSPHWSYEGAEGPEFWGKLTPNYALCANGLNQSPINITNTITADTSNIIFNYQPTPLNIINNGHTIQVNYDKGSSIKVDGTSYQLLQFHFHTLSEHTLNGKHSAMEMHFVHKSDEGNLAVVGVMMNQGRENSSLAPIWEHLPKKAGEEQHIDGVTINAMYLLPKEQLTYQYSGSLTTPPCSEGVKWLVLTTPIEVSTAQVAAFESIIGHNYRPVQPLTARQVLKDSK